MSTMVSGHWGRALEPGVSNWYGRAYAEYPEFHKSMFDMSSSKKSKEEDIGVFSFGLAQVRPEGAPVAMDSENMGFIARYTHVEYALGFVISKILMEDDLYDVAGQRRAKALAFSMRQTKEVVAANVFNRATNTAYPGADGLPLLHTAHLLGRGGTFANKPVVDVDLSEAALEQAFIDIANYKDDSGNRIMLQPKTLIVGPANEFVAHRILKSERRVGTANNDINALASLGKIDKVIVNPFLTDPDAWFLVTTAPYGLRGFTRRADLFDMTEDWDTDNAKFKATMRFSFGWTDPRGVYGSVGA